MASRRLVERYIVRTMVPYTAAAFVLLTGMLFVQQSGRYLETIFRGTVPAWVVYDLALAVLPTVLIFTLPMAVLAGTIIGLGRLGSDSELIAMRAAGVSRWQVIAPAAVIGFIATLGALQLNLNEAPRAQQGLRRLAARIALYKLDSPVEPQTFTTDIPGYVLYVREGDRARGQWGGVFIQAKEADGGTRLITARAGRIDSSEEKSELVLQDAVQTKLPPAEGSGEQQYVVERLDQLRILFNTGRNELIERLQRPENKPDEMTFGELRRSLDQRAGPERREALLLMHKRVAISLSPLVFAFFGAVLALRLRRGSRGFGALTSLIVMAFYYLLVVAGEQMARGGTLPPWVGGWLSTSLVLIFGVILLFANRTFSLLWIKRSAAQPPVRKVTQPQKQIGRRSWKIRFPTLLDSSIVRMLALSFLFAFVALVIIFDIFTSFELWRFLATRGGSAGLLFEYLFFLLPLVAVELFPGSVLVAALLTYALVARRREAVAWWASGQSVYRLMLPGLAFAMIVGVGLWLIQERIMPAANVRQDDLRARIRGNPAQSTPGERRWLVSTDQRRIYSYEFDDRAQALIKPEIYEFDPANISRLKTIIHADSARWSSTPNRLEITNAKWFELDRPLVATQSAQGLLLDGVDSPRVFRPTVDRPSQLDANRLREYIKQLKARGADTAILAVGLQKKYAAPCAVIIMALIGMPLAVSLGRKSTVLALCSAVVVSLLFWLISSGFQQLGEHALLPPAVAVWAPIAIFAGGAFYFISRVRT